MVRCRLGVVRLHGQANPFFMLGVLVIIGTIIIMVKAVLYNPLSASNKFRVEKIGMEYFVFTPGTQGKAFEEPVTSRRHTNHTFFHWGWKRARFSNRSAGVGLGCSVEEHGGEEDLDTTK